MNFATFWKSKKFKGWFCAALPVAVLLLVIVVVLTANTFLYQTLNGAFGGERQTLKAGDASKYQYFTGDYDNKKDVLAAANELNAEIAGEGITLLKNENKALPIAEESKVTVFGKGVANLVLGGSGSNASSSGGDSKTIYDSLGAANIKFNPEMKSFYESSSRSGSGRPKPPDMNSTITGITGFPIAETPLASYDEKARASWTEYNEAAVVVLSRIGGEGFDLPRSMFWDGRGYQNWDGDQAIPGARSKDDHYLQLDQNETDMLKAAADNFDKVIVLINSPTLLELGFLDDPAHYAYSEKISACLWIGTPGNTGIMALGKILTGKINPSGRTVDIAARDYREDPTWNNFGNNLVKGGNQYVDESGSAKSAYFVYYAEGIYTGYRYYETRAYEEAKKGNSDWYGEHVVYPFGYGLSYSKFAKTVKSVAPADGKLDSDGQISVEVEVENTGGLDGKEVVQLYCSAPYTEGGIEKPQVELCAFAKTELIPAGEKRTVTLTVNVRDLASYDYNDANGNKFFGYELEADKYTFYVAENSHDTSMPIELTLDSDVMYRTNEDGKDVVNLFDDVSGRLTEYTKYMSRSDFGGTFPKLPTDEMRTLSKSDISKLNYKLNDSVTDPWYREIMPTQSASAMTFGETEHKLWHLIGKEYDDPLWEKLLDQLTVAEMQTLIEQGNYHTEAIESIDKPKTTDPDGPMGYSLFMGDPSVYDTCYYASESLMGATWNVELMRRFGEMIGNESIVGNQKGDGRPYAGWYAPAANLHRSQFGGRNFEYYSEDPLLSANLAVAVIKGAKSKGVYTYMKHFALNDQETNRDTNGLVTWANEQAMREMYFLPFEKAVKEGKTSAMMSSFNRIGLTWAGGSYTLLTTLLREEWGFKGTVVTDYNLTQYMNVDQMIRAGGDLNLSQSKALKSNNTATSVSAIRQAAKNILYTVANSNAMNGRGDGNVWGYSAPIWFIVMWTVYAVVMAGLAVWGVFVIRAVVIGYKSDVRNGIIVPVKKEKDPNFKWSKTAIAFVALVAFVTVSTVAASLALMLTPELPAPIEQNQSGFVSAITLTFNNREIADGAVTVEKGTADNKVTVLVNSYGVQSQGVKFASSVPTVAEVAADGTLTAVSVGETVVTASVVADETVSASLVVRVTDSTAVDDTTVYAVTVEGGTASVAESVAGETIVLTPQTVEGKIFTGWEVVSGDAETNGNSFVMPHGDVVIRAVFVNKTYTLTLQDAAFADGTTSATLEFGQALPADIDFVVPDGKAFKGWIDINTDETYAADLTMPATDITVRPLFLTDGEKLVMGKDGFDYDDKTDGKFGNTKIGYETALQMTVASGQKKVRIKPGGIISKADGADINAEITIRNDNTFDITFTYVVEYYGAEWKTTETTVAAGETVTLKLLIDGLEDRDGKPSNPYHQIRFSQPTTAETTISFYGYTVNGGAIQ